MIRLGVAVRIMGRAGLRARDGRRAEHAPHLSISLLLVREVLLYLAEQRIHCYRLADDLAPYLLDQRRPAFAHQIEECEPLLAETGALAHAHAIRLSMHLPLHVALASSDPAVAAHSTAEICARARLFDAMQLGSDAVLVVHVGGIHTERTAALRRFALQYERLPAPVRRRVVVELDAVGFGLADLLWLHQRIGVPLVFDSLHHQLNNPDQIALRQALALVLATWPSAMRPKVHVSTQRTEAHVLSERGGQVRQVLAPRPGQHADFINPFEFATLLSAAQGLPVFDCMLEAKAADLALLRLREDLARYTPAIAALVQ